MPSRLEETPKPGQSSKEYTRSMALKKINGILEQLQGRIPQWICSADTVISVNRELLGKPRDRGAARAMLEKLQGREHKVSTSVALFNGKNQTTDCRTVESRVCFVSLSEREMDWYVNTGEWQGVAGAYRIQGLGSCFISSVNGSYSAVVGLPIHEFYTMLMENGYQYAV
jgi:septum formation protein